MPQKFAFARRVMHVIPIEAIRSERVESTSDLGKEREREREKASNSVAPNDTSSVESLFDR